MLICDRCSRSDDVLKVHIAVTLVQPHTAVALKDMDLCKHCRECYRDMTLKFIEPLPKEATINLSRAIDIGVKVAQAFYTQPVTNNDVNRIARMFHQ